MSSSPNEDFDPINDIEEGALASSAEAAAPLTSASLVEDEPAELGRAVDDAREAPLRPERHRRRSDPLHHLDGRRGPGGVGSGEEGMTTPPFSPPKLSWMRRSSSTTRRWSSTRTTTRGR